MEVDEIQRQVRKFQRVSSNGSTTTTDNSSNPQKIATHKGNLELQKFDDGGGGGGGGGGIDVVVGGGGGGGVARLCGWPSSRIVRVSRASGGKDRHSKVLTSKGLRDRRVRLSVSTAIQFYDLQDRLGYDQPSKAVEWLLKAASTSIDELPSLDPSFSGAISHTHHHHQNEDKKSTGNSPDFEDPNYQQQNSNNNNNNNVSKAKSPACSSTSETSKGSGLSLSRSENRVKARERAREMASKKEREKETDSTRAAVLNQVNSISENSSFTDLLTGGIHSNTNVRRHSPESRTHWATPMDYFFARPTQPSTQLIQIPQFNITAGDNHQHQHHNNNNNPQHHFSFLQDSFVPAVTTGGGGGGESYNLNFSMTSSSGGTLAPGFSRGTLQSNLPSSLLPHHHHFQRFQSPSIDGSTSTNLPFFIVPNAASDHFPAAAGYHLSYGGGGGDGVGRHSDHHKEKTKN
ncbi:hypothetical protein Lser_V15G15535 [Lactuca serriola]